MNYKKIYDSIIEKRKLETPQDCYTEKHHIIPKSLGGDNNKDNLIILTSREHFICHYLLSKIYPKNSVEWYKMNHAFMMMKCDNICRGRYYNSKLYQSLRSNFSLVMSHLNGGINNPNYGKMWICNISTRENKIISKDGILPEGWLVGRSLWNKKIKFGKGLGRGNGRGDYCHLDKKKEIDILWNIFINGNYNSINEFSKSEYCSISQPALVKIFRKYIPEYDVLFKQGKTFTREA